MGTLVKCVLATDHPNSTFTFLKWYGHITRDAPLNLQPSIKRRFASKQWRWLGRSCCWCYCVWLCIRVCCVFTDFTRLRLVVRGLSPLQLYHFVNKTTSSVILDWSGLRNQDFGTIRRTLILPVPIEPMRINRLSRTDWNHSWGFGKVRIITVFWIIVKFYDYSYDYFSFRPTF